MKVNKTKETKEFFEITSISRDDIKGHFAEKGIKINVEKISDDEMTWIARKMADNYCNCCYWNSLENLVNSCSYYKNEKMSKMRNRIK